MPSITGNTMVRIFIVESVTVAAAVDTMAVVVVDGVNAVTGNQLCTHSHRSDTHTILLHYNGHHNKTHTS